MAKSMDFEELTSNRILFVTSLLLVSFKEIFGYKKYGKVRKSNKKSLPVNGSCGRMISAPTT